MDGSGFKDNCTDNCKIRHLKNVNCEKYNRHRDIVKDKMHKAM